MAEMRQIVELWRQARTEQLAVYLATVVHVDGSSYRKPGARMLVTSAGERAGSISGGCLEAEISRKIAWLTSQGQVVERYNSSFDDDHEGVPHGLGCGGIIWILMESGLAAVAVLESLERALDGMEPSVVVADLSLNSRETTVLRGKSQTELTVSYGDADPGLSAALLDNASRAMHSGNTIALPSESSNDLPRFLFMPILPPPRLTIFGAADDAQPIVRFAAELGWHVTVADGRTHLLRKDRFPQADRLQALTYEKREAQSSEESGTGFRQLTSGLVMSPDYLAVILTHSYEQDRALLQALLPQTMRYLGILGPLHRTTRLLDSVSPTLGLSTEECLAKLHAPVGLALGSGEPSVIALSIVSEMQASLAKTEGTVERKRDIPLQGDALVDMRQRLSEPQNFSASISTEVLAR